MARALLALAALGVLGPALDWPARAQAAAPGPTLAGDRPTAPIIPVQGEPEPVPQIQAPTRGLKTPAPSGARDPLSDPEPMPYMPMVDGQPAAISPVIALCERPEIRGRVLDPMPADPRGCGIAAPMQVHEVSGVALSPPAIVDCVTARSLNNWVRRSLTGPFGQAQYLRIHRSYDCPARTTPPDPMNRLLRRGRGIEISAIGLANGNRIDIAPTWQGGPRSQWLRRIVGDACRSFGMVLSPASEYGDRGLLFLGTADFTNSPYCR